MTLLSGVTEDLTTTATYHTIIIGANHLEKDVFKGVIAGRLPSVGKLLHQAF